MKLFLDCEFNDFQGELISMALVSDKGHEWYECLPCLNPSDWVKEHVIPVLGKEPLPTKMDLCASLQQFLWKFPDVTIVADWPEDIAHFCQTLIVGPGKRLDTPHLTFIVERIDSTSECPHNALSDARGIKAALCGDNNV